MDATIWKRLSENVDFVLSFDESKQEDEEESIKEESVFSISLKEEVKEIPKIPKKKKEKIEEIHVK